MSPGEVAGVNAAIGAVFIAALSLYLGRTLSLLEGARAGLRDAVRMAEALGAAAERAVPDPNAGEDHRVAMNTRRTALWNACHAAARAVGNPIQEERVGRTVETLVNQMWTHYPFGTSYTRSKTGLARLYVTPLRVPPPEGDQWARDAVRFAREVNYPFAEYREPLRVALARVTEPGASPPRLDGSWRVELPALPTAIELVDALPPSVDAFLSDVADLAKYASAANRSRRMEREISEAAAFLPVVVTMGAAALVALVCGAIAPTVVVGLPLWVTRWVPAVIYGGGALVAFVMVSLPLRVPRPD